MTFVKASVMTAGALMLSSALVVAQAPAAGRAAGAAQGRGRGAAPAPPSNGGMGPNDRPPVDARAADLGRTVYAAECINCHGTQARGTSNGPNLVRSLVVLHDRYGSELGPFLKKGHTLQSGKPSAGLTEEQITQLANFLRQRVNDTLRGAPNFDAKDVLTGDPKAGAEFFNGAGHCTQCHAVTGNLAGIGTRLSPVNLQQRFLFPARSAGRGGRAGGRGAAPAAPTAVTVTVTPAGEPAVAGTLIQMDDFTVSLRDEAGRYRTFTRTPSLRVEKQDPLAAHIALLDTLTDKNIHDVVAYLETVK